MMSSESSESVVFGNAEAGCCWWIFRSFYYQQNKIVYVIHYIKEMNHILFKNILVTYTTIQKVSKSRLHLFTSKRVTL